MNFLAHIYLSKESQLSQLGNFLGDFVKGSDFENYPLEIKNGILLHRAIDSYTDSHGIIAQSKERLKEEYGRYAGVAVDIFYDHFLAKNWSDFADIELDDFVNKFYQTLRDNYDILPSKIQRMLPVMIKENWLFNYQFISGIQKVMYGMERRIKYRVKLSESVRELHLHYNEFEEEFMNFLPELQKNTEFEKQKLNNR